MIAECDCYEAKCQDSRTLVICNLTLAIVVILYPPKETLTFEYGHGHCWT